MALLKFLKGNYSNLSNAAINEGQVLICGDTGEMFVDVAADKRVKIGDFVVVSTLEALEALDASAVPTSRLYYVEQGNILARSNGATWTQINKQPTTAELKVALGLNADGDVTKAIAAAKKAGDDAQVDVDNLTTYVGTIPNGEDGKPVSESVIAYINKKTDGIATSGNLEALGARVTTAETDIDNLEKAIAEGGSVANAIAEAKKAGDDAQAHSEGVASDLDDHEKDAVAHITAEERTAWNGKTTMADVEAKGYLVASDIAGKADKTQVATDIADAVKVETDNRVLADQAIEAKIGTVAEGKTVVKMIEDAQAAATYDDEEVRGLISGNAADIKAIADDYLKGADKEALQGNIDTVSGKVTTLIGEDANKSVRTIANEELAKQLIAEDADASLDTLTEIATWIQSHPDDASAMNEAIVALQNKVVLGTYVEGEETKEYATVKAYVEAAIAALQIGDYAKAADLTELAGRVTDLETASATKDELKAVQDQIDALDDTYATDAELTTAMEAEVTRADGAYAGKAYESTVDTHIADAVAHITADERTAWNAAEQNAKDYADGLNTAMDTRVKVLEAIDHDAYKAYADQAELDAIASAKTETETQVGAEKTAREAADTTLQGNIDTVSGALNTYKTENNAAVALKANSADVYTKVEIETMLTWGSF